MSVKSSDTVPDGRLGMDTYSTVPVTPDQPVAANAHCSALPPSLWPGLVAVAAVGAAVFLHLGLREMAPAVKELVADGPLDPLERGVVAGFVLLDHLECPPPGQHV